MEVLLLHGYESVVSICEVLGDRISCSVLLSVIKSVKSASEISIQGGLPISSTYKALKKLQEAGLIKASLVDRDGRRLSIYKSKIKECRIIIGAKDSKVELTPLESDVSDSNELESSKEK